MALTIVLTALVTLLLVVVAMNFATSEKQLERRIDHCHPVRSDQFRREMSVMMGPSVLAGNRVEQLQNGVEIFPAMLRAIRAARVSITFETYIYWSGEIGREFSEALSERAEAGIPVHVTIDWVGSIKMDQALLARMEASGVQLQRYRPLHWYNLGRMNNRTHRKLLIVDGRLGFTGGVGIADQWQGNGNDPEHWRDVHFEIEGPVVAQLQAAFNDNWIKTTGIVLRGPTYFPPLVAAGSIDAHLFISSPPGGSESMHLMYLLALGAAEESIDLAASYFVPDTLTLQALIAARGRGVRVRILVPGHHIDSEAVRLSSKATWGALLEAGVAIFQYQPTMLHTKLMVIDGLFVSVGSTNFDARSFRLNDEASLNAYDRGFASRVTATFEADLAQAEPYTYQMWQARSLGARLMEGLLWPIRSQL